MNSRTSKKVIIAGYYGYQNAGDEAILHGMLAELGALKQDLEFIVLCGDPKATEAQHPVKAIAWSDIEATVKVVKKASLVIVGGGGLMQDYWGVDPSSFLRRGQGGISEYGSPILLAKLLGVPCMFYAIGVGPLKTPQGRRITRLLFEMADGATVRDQGSLELLVEIGASIEGLPIVADPAFRAPFSPMPAMVQARLGELPRPHLGVSLRHWEIGVDAGDWQGRAAAALDQVIEAIGGTAIFVPMQRSDYFLENDQHVSEQVAAAMAHRERTFVLADELDAIQRFSIMGSFDLLLGMRLHALIAGLRSGSPCVGLIYDPKVRALLQGFGLDDCCWELGAFDPDLLATGLIHFFQSEKDRFAVLAAELRESSAALSAGAILAGELLVRARSSARHDLIADLALHQTLNLAQSEKRYVRLNQVFRGIWKERLDPNFSMKHDQADLAWIKEQLLADQERMKTLSADREAALEKVRLSEIAVEEMQRKVRAHERRLEALRKKHLKLEESFQELQKAGERLLGELWRIESSKGYKVLRILWKMVWWVRDPKQMMLEIGESLRKMRLRIRARTRGLRSFIRKAITPFLPIQLRYLSFLVSQEHVEIEDRSQVVLYSDDDRLFADYRLRRRLSGHRRGTEQVSLAITIRNEAENAARWLADLERQSRAADEVILIDGGSTDGTYEILQEAVAKTNIKIRLFSEPGKNIAVCRNLGVKLAEHSLIAMTDFGCTLKKDWLEKLLIPFAADPETEVVAGWYEAEAAGRVGASAKHELVPSLSHISPDTFLPSTRSLAFRRSAWEKAGGFPEWLTKTGEDTYFDLQLKRNCQHWAFVPDARVIWHAPETMPAIWQKLSSWTVGDGESGAFLQRYGELTAQAFSSAFFLLLGLGLSIGLFWVDPLLGLLAMSLWGLSVCLSFVIGKGSRKGITQGFWRFFGRAARVDGFLRGVRSRPVAVARRHSDTQGIFLLLTGVPFDDTGGGARGTQIALELLQRGNLVVFVHKYPKQESVDLKMDYEQPHLLHFALEHFDWKAMCWELRHLLETKPLTAILEFPFREVLPVVQDVQRRGGKVVYDLIDEWNTSLGGDWYSPSVEQAIVDLSDGLAASAPSLVERLQRASGRQVLYLPNAVNLRLFDRSKDYECPEDLPEGSPKILYIGALWGEWFDWELLGKIADEFPQAAVTVIGDYRGQCPFDKINLFFLGLKPQPSLPAYLAHADVAIIPWEISPITQATSPLKVFEYIAMGVPVVAPALKPLEGIPHVFLAKDPPEFLELIRQAQSCEIDEQVLADFLRENSWAARIDKLEGKLKDLAALPTRAGGRMR